MPCGMLSLTEPNPSEVSHAMGLMQKEIQNLQSTRESFATPLKMLSECFQLRSERPTSESVEDAVQHLCHARSIRVSTELTASQARYFFDKRDAARNENRSGSGN